MNRPSFSLTLNPTLGSHISDCLNTAKTVAVTLNVRVVFTFNDERFVVNPDSNTSTMLRQYEEKHAQALKH